MSTVDDDDRVYDHSWRNKVVVAFGILSFFFNLVLHSEWRCLCCLSSARDEKLKTLMSI